MIVKLFFGLSFYGLIFFANAQAPFADSLKKFQHHPTNDTVSLTRLEQIAEAYTETNPDSSLHYAALARELAIRIKAPLEEVYLLGKMGYALNNKGDYARALKIFLTAVTLAQNAAIEKHILNASYPSPDEFINREAVPAFQRLDNLTHIYQYLGILYANGNNFEKAFQYSHMAIDLTQRTGNVKLACITNISLGRFYLAANNPDSSLIVQQKAYDQAIQADYPRYLGSILLNLARIYLVKGDKEKAATFLHKAYSASILQDYKRGAVASELLLSNYYIENSQKDSGLLRLNNALAMAEDMESPDLLLRCYNSLAQYYKSSGISDSVVRYLELSNTINENIFNTKQSQQFQNIDFDEKERLQELEKEREKIKSKNKANLMLIALGALGVIAFILSRNNRQKQKANAILENTLTKLKTTQTQLIQSEKMASLGELTAGIAHEIQNPLNFVNNFSELSSELIGEMHQEIGTGNMTEVKAIADDLMHNLEKITMHGTRASNIVKGMLEHSGTRKGDKVLTDINALVEEYVRLANHASRSKIPGLHTGDPKDSNINNYNIEFIIELDPKLPKVAVIPQDIGRVLLNLINNAVYAVHTVVTPQITIKTEKLNNQILIKVRDNGTGMPESIRAKVFQPFFTTKPPGQGIGLGLSLAYDIVTNGHGGSIVFESYYSHPGGKLEVTNELTGTTFIISLPID